jgi:hypothetical protein
MKYKYTSEKTKYTLQLKPKYIVHNSFLIKVQVHSKYNFTKTKV